VSGIPGGLETAIHVTHHYITQHVSNSSLGLSKIDMKNAFNECSHQFSHIVDDFPEISAWIKWCYFQPAELCFGSRILLGCNKVILWDLFGFIAAYQFFKGALYSIYKVSQNYSVNGHLVSLTLFMQFITCKFATNMHILLLYTLSLKLELVVFNRHEIFT